MRGGPPIRAASAAPGLEDRVEGTGNELIFFRCFGTKALIRTVRP